MAYTINKFNGTELVVLEDGTIDTSTSLGLVGRNYVGYGETQNENFVFLSYEPKEIEYCALFESELLPLRRLILGTDYNIVKNMRKETK